MSSAAQTCPIDAFIARWRNADGSERANYQLFFTELCKLLELPKPDPAALNRNIQPHFITSSDCQRLTRYQPQTTE